MPLRLIIDGYNVVSPKAPPKRSDSMWLHRERMLLIDRLIKHLPPELCHQTCVVFDAANPPRDRPSQFTHGGVDVRFAVDYPEADDLIEELIACNHHPKQLTVISSDHRVQEASKRRGATCFDSQEWLDGLLDGNLRLAKGIRQKIEERLTSSDAPGFEDDPGFEHEVTPDAGQGRGPANSAEVEKWMREFGFETEL